MCGAIGVALAAPAAAQTPGRFVDPEDSRPIVISLDGPIESTPPARTLPAESAASERAAPSSALKAPSVANRAAAISEPGRATTARRVHLSFVEEGDDGQGPVVLRWRSGELDATEMAAIAQQQQQLKNESVRYASGSDSSRALAVGWQEDPLSDPFGDRAVFQEAPAELPPMNQDPPATDRLPDALDAAPPLPMALQPRQGNPLYNDQDCEAELRACRQARDQLRNRSIRDIALDISPEFNPVTAETMGRTEQRRQDFLDHTRIFKDLDGNAVATGSLSGFRNGRVIIRTTEGQDELVPYRLLSDDDRCYVAAWWGIPIECGLDRTPYAGRDFVPSTMTWRAPALCHKPLYFEDVQLERHGHSAGPLVQPAVSGAKFFVNVAALPYRMGIHPPTECQYPLGHYRPGSCAPWLVPPIPLSLRGGLAEAGAIVGGVFVIP